MMAKQLNCADVGFECGAQMNGDTEEEVMAQAAEHAKDVHGMSEGDLQQHESAIRGAIRDV
jgi:predicted small metal-binding protein